MNEENRFYEISIAEAKNKCVDKLIKICEEAKISKPSKEFEIYNLNDLNDLKKIKNAIYIFEEIAGDSEKTFAKFSEYKQKKERACPKLNSHSQVLYVGSSTTGIVNRLKQHKGDATSVKTYALQLDHWFTGQYKITIKEYEVSPCVIQIIEDALSDILKPAFGKKGGNNK